MVPSPGSNHMYVLMNPLKPETADNSLPKEITWEYAQKEIAQVKGFATGSAGLSKGNTNIPRLDKSKFVSPSYFSIYRLNLLL